MLWPYLPGPLWSVWADRDAWRSRKARTPSLRRRSASAFADALRHDGQPSRGSGPQVPGQRPPGSVAVRVVSPWQLGSAREPLAAAARPLDDLLADRWHRDRRIPATAPNPYAAVGLSALCGA